MVKRKRSRSAASLTKAEKAGIRRFATMLKRDIVKVNKMKGKKKKEAAKKLAERARKYSAKW